MDLRFTAQDEEFRCEVVEWLEANLPAEWRDRGIGGFREDEDPEIQRQWHQRLYTGGWLKLGWSQESGGRGASIVQQAIFQEELAIFGAPPMLGRNGVTMAAPTIDLLGSDWQKATYIERILSCQEVWAQGFSEPDAGSDLAGLKTRAERRDGRWALNGQKIWSSHAKHARRSFLLARTDPDAPVHQGIGFFIVDLEQPGVEIRPIRQLTGGQDFCEIFLADALVEDRDVVGSPTDGWRAAMTTFGFERGALVSPARYDRVADSLVELVRELGRGDDPLVRQAVAQAKIEVHIFRMNQLRALTKRHQGMAPGPEASLTKLFWSEMNRRMQETATAIQGPYAALERGADRALEGGLWQDSWMWSLAETIYAGTSEIQRSIIAERVLGLPRGR